MKFLVTLYFFLVSFTASPQDSSYARHIIDTLTSSRFWGRGYTNSGMKNAAVFLAGQMKLHGLVPMGGSNYYQNFTYPVNTFPGRMEATVNGTRLMPGKDFLVSPGSKGFKGSGKFVRKDSNNFIGTGKQVTLSITNKLTWSVATTVANVTSLWVDKNSLNDEPVAFSFNIENEFVKRFAAANVCGMVKGTVRPDSIIVLTAHYDHLGGMGNRTYFPGANDNASGVSLLLSLAKYYAANPQPYTIGFVCFAGEEAGLIGSKYFTEHPLILLRQVRFLINLDLVGTGSEGITVVNASTYPREFQLLNQTNNTGNYFTKINARGKAANSDHYWFSEKSVPSFFIYTLGGIKAYHDVNDIAQTLPMTEHNDLFRLIIEFNAKLIR